MTVTALFLPMGRRDHLMIKVLRLILLILALFIFVPAVAGAFLMELTFLGILIPSIVISSLTLFILAVLYDKGKSPIKHKLNRTALISGFISLLYLLLELNDGITRTSIILFMLFLVSLILYGASINRDKLPRLLAHNQCFWHIGRISLGIIVLITLVIPLITFLSEVGLWVLHNLTGGGRFRLTGLRYFDFILTVTYSKQGIVLLALILLIAITSLILYNKKT